MLSSNLDNQLQSILNMPDAKLASLAVVVVDNDDIVFKGYYGSRYIDPLNPANNLAVNQDTKFRIASISKLVATIGAMQLVERGLLDLDADINGYLGFTLRNPHYPDIPITTRMLVSHTSSIRDASVYSIPLPYQMSDFFLPMGAFYADGEHFAIPTNEIDPVPGKYFHYCNLNFGLLASIMESVSGERFDEYMSEHVLKPLGIDGGYNVHHISDEGFKNIATLYRKFDGEKWNPAGKWYPQVDDYEGIRPASLARIENPDSGDSSGSKSIMTLEDYQLGSNGTMFSPQGGLRISALDLAKILQVCLNHGRYGDTRILKPESITQMMANHWTYDAQAKNGDTHDGMMRSWGLSMQRTTATQAANGGDKITASSDIKMYGHGGDAYGLLSGLWFNPERKIGFIYMLGGVAKNPENYQGEYSSFYRWEEQIMTAIFDTFFSE